jgi:hypothetical protein
MGRPFPSTATPLLGSLPNAIKDDQSLSPGYDITMTLEDDLLETSRRIYGRAIEAVGDDGCKIIHDISDACLRRIAVTDPTLRGEDLADAHDRLAIPCWNVAGAEMKKTMAAITREFEARNEAIRRWSTKRRSSKSRSVRRTKSDNTDCRRI